MTPAVDVQHRFIAWIIKDDTGEAFAECRPIPVDVFSDPSCRKAWRAITTASSYTAAVTHRDVLPFFGHETIGTEYKADQKDMLLAWLDHRGLGDIHEWVNALPGSVNKSKLRDRLAARAFNLSTPPPAPVPRFLINGIPISTSGNLTCISSQPGRGKSAMKAAMLAAAICAEFGNTGRDTLGVTAAAPGGLTLIDIDTEQSPYDAHLLTTRAFRRAGVEAHPSFLQAYSVAGFSPNDTRATIPLLMAQAASKGGIHSLIIDAVADAVNDVNDLAESNAFVAELHDLAITHQCPIIGVIHENTGQEGGKMRGHLGSQMMRKAETVISLKKDDEVTVVFSTKARKAPITERNGPRFAWSDEAMMHVSVAGNSTLREDENLSDLRNLADEVFSGGRLRYGDACEKIEKARRMKEGGGGKWFTRLRKASVIHDAGLGYWERKAA